MSNDWIYSMIAEKIIIEPPDENGATFLCFIVYNNGS